MPHIPQQSLSSMGSAIPTPQTRTAPASTPAAEPKVQNGQSFRSRLIGKLSPNKHTVDPAVVFRGLFGHDYALDELTGIVRGMSSNQAKTIPVAR